MKVAAHDHRYTQDTRDGREEFARCTVCGFSAPKRLLVSPSNGMILDRNLSPELLEERRTLRAARGIR